MSVFRHKYRVFEQEKTQGNQYWVTLISNPDMTDDRRQPDRTSTGSHLGKLRVLVDMGHMDTFAVGKQFTLTIEQESI